MRALSSCNVNRPTDLEHLSDDFAVPCTPGPRRRFRPPTFNNEHYHGVPLPPAPQRCPHLLWCEDTITAARITGLRWHADGCCHTLVETTPVFGPETRVITTTAKGIWTISHVPPSGTERPPSGSGNGTLRRPLLAIRIRLPAHNCTVASSLGHPLNGKRRKEQPDT
ncbi:hypothetical protein BV898_08072 [Hypsibius exemplaris]|uniref:Uncharacterized protein n=1 Tax=Hypsibius exemplaris TaxID=2072580 RepID=A0A1W0WRF2_HYPEX|nr:hypothetical protein BV898_08072 [Hypsibius exemplaris]